MSSVENSSLAQGGVGAWWWGERGYATVLLQQEHQIEFGKPQITILSSQLTQTTILSSQLTHYTIITVNTDFYTIITVTNPHQHMFMSMRWPITEAEVPEVKY